MPNVITAAAIAAALTVAGTSESEGSTDEVSQIEACTSISELAEVVMQKRQGGARMSEMIAVVQDNDLHVKIVQDAYEAPRYSTDRVQQREINDFTNEWFAGCMKATED